MIVRKRRGPIVDVTHGGNLPRAFHLICTRKSVFHIWVFDVRSRSSVMDPEIEKPLINGVTNIDDNKPSNQTSEAEDPPCKAGPREESGDSFTSSRLKWGLLISPRRLKWTDLITRGKFFCSHAFMHYYFHAGGRDDLQLSVRGGRWCNRSIVSIMVMFYQ